MTKCMSCKQFERPLIHTTEKKCIIKGMVRWKLP